jgi:hypothetical protein
VLELFALGKRGSVSRFFRLLPQKFAHLHDFIVEDQRLFFPTSTHVEVEYAGPERQRRTTTHRDAATFCVLAAQA